MLNRTTNEYTTEILCLAVASRLVFILLNNTPTRDSSKDAL